jgi:hypothetical protein
MSTCYITSGVALGCSDGIGGIKKIYVLGGSGNTVSAIATKTDGSITGATGSGVWYGFELKRNTSALTQTLAKNFENGTVYYTPELLAVFYKYDAVKRDQVLTLSHNDNIKVIGVDQNDVQYYLGETNGLYLSAGVLGTGTNFADRNGMEVTFSGMEPNPARVIDGTLATVFSGFTFS